MTLYSDAEESAHDASPVEGYKFIGTSTNYLLTTANTDQTINGEVYTSIEIKRGTIKSGNQSDDSLDIQLEVPYDIQLIKDYGYTSSPPDLSLEVRRFHVGTNPATDWVLIWKGKVTGFSISGHIAKIRVPSIFALALQGVIPSAFYQAPCNHVLYDARCKVVEATFKQTTTIATGGVTSATITVVNDGFIDNFLNAGIIHLTGKGERRLIIKNIANVITINFPFNNAADADAVDLTAGCDHAFAGDCITKFNNQINFGGFPFIPTDNPFEGNL